jgi:hypothetical protein
MGLRKSISKEELGSNLSNEDREKYGTDYKPSRGGYFKSEPKPTPGKPKSS